MTDALQQKVKNLPNKPGCYIYYNDQHKVIYVGKAKNLKKRVATYFNRAQNLKTTRLVREIVDLEFIIVNNERESLLLEENLIKKYRPRFNILLNDDKSYPYIIVTNEKDPEYKYVRKYDKKALRSYGPLPIGAGARDILITLQRLFPLRRCKGNLGKPCLYYHLHQCSGACFKEVDPQYYKQQLKHVDRFFKGQTDEVVGMLEKKMQIASDNLQFEEANRIKELLNNLQFALSKNIVELNDKYNRDVFSYYLDDEKISIIVLFYRAGKLLLKDEYVGNYDEQDINDLMSTYMQQIYQKNMLPDQIIIPNDLDFDLIDPIIKSKITKPITKLETNLNQLAYTNAVEALKQSNLKSQTVNNNEGKILEELQKILNLNVFPNHIEMFDISNIANEFVTGSVVVYKNGKPSRNDFRKYNIEIEQKDDSSRLANMIYRRYQKALVEKREFPDLIVMDGGLIQIHAAKKQLELLDLSIPVVGLVKDDHHTTDYLIDLNEQKINLNRQTPIYNFLANIQVRVDAFAKSGFRKKQTSSLVFNQLENVKGLGKKKIQELLKIYPTIFEMKKASFDQLNQIIKNINTTTNLMDYLNSNV